MMEMELAIAYLRPPPRDWRCYVWIFEPKKGRESCQAILTEPREAPI